MKKINENVFKAIVNLMDEENVKLKTDRGIMSETNLGSITNSGKKSITAELEEMAVTICHNFCKYYRNHGKCQRVIDGNICPLRTLLIKEEIKNEKTK